MAEEKRKCYLGVFIRTDKILKDAQIIIESLWVKQRNC